MCAVGHVSRMCSGDVQLGALAKLQYCSFSMAKPKRLIRRGQASRPQGALSGGGERAQSGLTAKSLGGQCSEISQNKRSDSAQFVLL